MATVNQLSDFEAGSLARVVNDAARRAPASARFCGGRKVFVSALAEGLSYCGGLELFKARLVELNRRGLISLVRFDLSYAADMRLQAESEIRDGGATFHCVEDPDYSY